MSTMGLLFNKIGRTEEVLETLNDALLALQVSQTGRAEELGYSNSELDSAREDMVFVLAAVIEGLEDDPAKAPKGILGAVTRQIVKGLDNLGRPHADWVHDFHLVMAGLRDKQAAVKFNWKPVEAVITVMETQVSGDLRRLYR